MMFYLREYAFYSLSLPGNSIECGIYGDRPLAQTLDVIGINQNKSN